MAFVRSCDPQIQAVTVRNSKRNLALFEYSQEKSCDVLSRVDNQCSILMESKNRVLYGVRMSIETGAWSLTSSPPSR